MTEKDKAEAFADEMIRKGVSFHTEEEMRREMNREVMRDSITEKQVDTMMAMLQAFGVLQTMPAARFNALFVIIREAIKLASTK